MLQKVLIIDDVPAVHRLVCTRLNDDVYDIRSAYNAEDGQSLVNSFAPDLILLDIDLPGEDGFAFCQRLKQDPVTARIPVIFLTAAHETEQKIHGLELGAVDFVTKPFDPAELRARVRASLRTKSLIDTLSHQRVNDFYRDLSPAHAAHAA